MKRWANNPEPKPVRTKSLLVRSEPLEEPRPGISIRLDRDILEDVDAFAAKRGWSRSKWIEMACVRMILSEKKP